MSGVVLISIDSGSHQATLFVPPYLPPEGWMPGLLHQADLLGVNVHAATLVAIPGTMTEGRGFDPEPGWRPL